MQISSYGWFLKVILASSAWVILYAGLPSLSAFLLNHFAASLESRAYNSLSFFVEETPEVFLVLILVVFVAGVARSFFAPEKARVFLASQKEGVGNVLAAFLGVAVPFCTCSAVPVFIAFVSAGVPLGVTFSFLIAAPMVNEIALGLLFSLMGWKVTVCYLASGLGLAIVAGFILEKLHVEKGLQPWVLALREQPHRPAYHRKPSAAERLQMGAVR